MAGGQPTPPREIRSLGPPSEGIYAKSEIAADSEHRGANRRENGENADLAPLRSAPLITRCGRSAKLKLAGFAIALARVHVWLDGIK